MADDLMPVRNADPYRALGVRPFINCCASAPSTAAA